MNFQRVYAANRTPSGGRSRCQCSNARPSVSGIRGRIGFDSDNRIRVACRRLVASALTTATNKKSERQRVRSCLAASRGLTGVRLVRRSSSQLGCKPTGERPRKGRITRRGNDAIGSVVEAQCPAAGFSGHARRCTGWTLLDPGSIPGGSTTKGGVPCGLPGPGVRRNPGTEARASDRTLSCSRPAPASLSSLAGRMGLTVPGQATPADWQGIRSPGAPPAPHHSLPRQYGRGRLRGFSGAQSRRTR